MSNEKNEHIDERGHVEGEGSYTGTRRYNENLEKHIQKGNVEQEAREAKRALEGDEGDQLREAERRAKQGPKRVEPAQR